MTLERCLLAFRCVFITSKNEIFSFLSSAFFICHTIEYNKIYVLCSYAGFLFFCCYRSHPVELIVQMRFHSVPCMFHSTTYINKYTTYYTHNLLFSSLFLSDSIVSFQILRFLFYYYYYSFFNKTEIKPKRF